VKREPAERRYSVGRDSVAVASRYAAVHYAFRVTFVTVAHIHATFHPSPVPVTAHAGKPWGNI
jgi:hypothetical protein